MGSGWLNSDPQACKAGSSPAKLSFKLLHCWLLIRLSGYLLAGVGTVAFICTTQCHSLCGVYTVKAFLLRGRVRKVHSEAVTSCGSCMDKWQGFPPSGLGHLLPERAECPFSVAVLKTIPFREWALSSFLYLHQRCWTHGQLSRTPFPSAVVIKNQEGDQWLWQIRNSWSRKEDTVKAIVINRIVNGALKKST